MKKLFAIALTVFFLSSCNTPEVVYFRDLKHLQEEAVRQVNDIHIRPEDKLSIVVNSRDPQLTTLFNLPYTSQRIGASLSTGLVSFSGGTQGIMCYTVDSDGCIDFPVMGRLHIAGKKRDEIAAYIKSELISQNLVKDPVVTVEYAGLYFNVLGEVNNPGRYAFDRDHFTLLDALGMAGDLTINGQRDNITVIRENGASRTSYKVNLLSGQELFNSPVYYLQQNDVVYVEPNEYRARQSTVNDNTVRSAPFWISLASFLTTIGVLIFK